MTVEGRRTSFGSSAPDLVPLSEYWKEMVAGRRRSPQRNLLASCLEARVLVGKRQDLGGSERSEKAEALRALAALESEQPPVDPSEAAGAGAGTSITPWSLQIHEAWMCKLETLRADTDTRAEQLHEAVSSSLFCNPENRTILGVTLRQTLLTDALVRELNHVELEDKLPRLIGAALFLADQLDASLEEGTRLARSARACRARAPSGEFDADGAATAGALGLCLKLQRLGVGNTPTFLGTLPQSLRCLWAGPLHPGQYSPLQRRDGTLGVLGQHEGARGPGGPIYTILEAECEALGRYSEICSRLAAAAPSAVCTPVALHGDPVSGKFQLVLFVAEKLGRGGEQNGLIGWAELAEIGSSSLSELCRQRVAAKLASLVLAMHRADIVLGQKATLSSGVMVRLRGDDNVDLRFAAVVGPRVGGSRVRRDDAVPEGLDGEAADVNWAAATAVELCGSTSATAACVAPFLVENPEDRPAAGCLLEELSLWECECCANVRRLQEMTECGKGHAVCRPCLERGCTGAGSPPSVQKLGAARCPYSEGPGLGNCYYEIDRLVTGASPDAVDSHLRAQVAVFERMAAHAASDWESAQNCRRALEPGGRKRVILAHLEDKVLPARCPRCGQHFDNYEACAALDCCGCGCAFCAWCGADCGDDAHSHVLDCEERGEPRLLSMPFSAPFGAFERAQKRRRVAAVNSTLAACEDAELAEELREELRRRLDDLDSESQASSLVPPDDLNDGVLAAAVAG